LSGQTAVERGQRVCFREVDGRGWSSPLGAGGGGWKAGPAGKEEG
jgi:hypothetical protein